MTEEKFNEDFVDATLKQYSDGINRQVHTYDANNIGSFNVAQASQVGRAFAGAATSCNTMEELPLDERRRHAAVELSIQYNSGRHLPMAEIVADADVIYNYLSKGEIPPTASGRGGSSFTATPKGNKP